MKKAFIVFFSLFSMISFAHRIDEYEYVIIPTKFDFQRSANEYKLNELLKEQMEEFGFKAFYSDDNVVVNASDPCLFLTANVKNVSNIFLFKLMIEFMDCNNAVVYQAEIGSSKEKDRNVAFAEALENALDSVILEKYKFAGVSKEIILKESQEPIVVLEKPRRQDEGVEKEKASSSAEKVVQQKDVKVKDAKVAVVEKKTAKVDKPVVSANNVNTVKSKEIIIDSNSEKNKEVVVAKVKKAQVIVEKVKVEESKQVDDVKPVAEVTKKEKQILLYAQAIEDGYQLIDTTPKIVMKITKTLQPDYYTANVDKKFGVVFMKNGIWVFEYYLGGNLITDQLNIKFCN